MLVAYLLTFVAVLGVELSVLGRSSATEPDTLPLKMDNLMCGTGIRTSSRPRELNVPFRKVEAVISVLWTFLRMT